MFTICFIYQIVQNFTSVHLSNVELKNMGQQIMGSYPVHFHLCGDVDGSNTYVEGLSIHHSFSRCVTVHATNGLLVRFISCSEICVSYKVWVHLICPYPAYFSCNLFGVEKKLLVFKVSFALGIEKQLLRAYAFFFSSTSERPSVSPLTHKHLQVFRV